MVVKTSVKVLIGLTAVAVVCVVVAHDSMLSAQQRPAPEQPRTDVNAELLAEVRALRADLAQSNQAGVRAQLLVARAQLQEQRIMYFDRRRTDLTARTADAAEKTRQKVAELAGIEAKIKEFRSPTLPIPKEQLSGMLEMFQNMAEQLKADVQAASELEQRLRSEEADVQSLLAAEQGRWSDFNARLDELERALPK
jgi:hypothetical protein